MYVLSVECMYGRVLQNFEDAAFTFILVHPGSEINVFPLIGHLMPLTPNTNIL